MVLVSAFLGVAALQALHGLHAGNQPADVAADLRAVLGWGTALIALPILAEPAARTRLLRGLVVVGLLLGLWGIAQWTLNLPLASSGDTGVRAGVSLTTAGRGQLQGGMFGFPLVVLSALGALLCAPRMSPAVRWLLAAILALNAISLLLTFERTLWVATALGFGTLVARAPRARRARVLVAGAVTLAALIAAMAVVAPSELRTAGQRLAAIGQYRSDASVRYRLLESRHVVERVQAHPLAGSGLGAQILWGIPYAQVPPRFQTYSHDGYLWLAWKLGVPAAVLLMVILALAIASRAPPPERDPLRAVRAGAQAGLVTMLVVGIAFPTFGAAPVTPVLGVLIAVCASGRAPAFGARRPSAAHSGWALAR